MTSRCKKIHALIVIFGTLLLGCEPVRPPADLLGAASRALASARDAGAAEHAGDTYAIAGERFDQAQEAQLRRKYAKAANLALESQLSSELALAQVRLARLRAELVQLRQAHDVLAADLARAPAEGVPP